jgi:hypothetical protein
MTNFGVGVGGIVIREALGGINRKNLRDYDAPDGNTRQVILATTAAKSSITIKDLYIVADTGLINIPIYDSARRTTASISDITQRAGRVGRVSDGRYLRPLYRLDASLHATCPAARHSDIQLEPLRPSPSRHEKRPVHIYIPSLWSLDKSYHQEVAPIPPQQRRSNNIRLEVPSSIWISKNGPTSLWNGDGGREMERSKFTEAEYLFILRGRHSLHYKTPFHFELCIYVIA